MFNTSKNSSERSTSRRDDGHSQRGPSTQRSRSARSSSSRRSDSKPEWKIPPWVHCENCCVAYDINPNLSLLSCGHILCRTCLHLDSALLSHDPIPCVRCKTSETYRPIDGSLDEKLHGMFQQFWTDPVLQINVRHMQFMMTKTQNYTKFLSKNFKQTASLPPEWEKRQNVVKKSMERIQHLRKTESEINKKAELLKAEAVKVYKNANMLRSMYERKKIEFEGKKAEFERKKAEFEHKKAENERKKVEFQRQKQQREFQKQRVQGNTQTDMKLISSGRNEQSNQYIGQLKSSHDRSENQNRSAPIIRDFSQKVVPPARQNTSLPMHRGDSSRFSSENSSKRSAMPSATFRPKPRDIHSNNRPIDPRQHGSKRFGSSYDQNKNPSKRPALNLNASISSVGSSTILNPRAKW